MRSFQLLFPAVYFFKTRLNKKSAIVYHGFSEFVLGVLLLFYFNGVTLAAVYSFCFAFIAFISIYEIGYFYNDYISIRFEKNARKRLGKWKMSKNFICLFILLRVAIFYFVSIYLSAFENPHWLSFYLLLILVFYLHNSLRIREQKVLTFISLATMRFYAPVFLFLTPEDLAKTVPGILLFYVFYRALTYMDSKDLLNFTGRASVEFKFNYFLAFLPLSAIMFLFTDSWITLCLNIYFLLFWFSLLILVNTRQNLKSFLGKDLSIPQ